MSVNVFYKMFSVRIMIQNYETGQKAKRPKARYIPLPYFQGFDKP